MHLALVGTSHRVAPVEVRERLALGPREAGELSRRLAGSEVEAVCLSTCNRTELYLAGADADALERLGVEALARLAGVDEAALAPILYRLRDEAAALHAFRVAAGLDSLVPGEGEILGQVRGAAESGAAGPFLDRLFRQALHTGRKVRSETAIGESPASVSSAAAALAQQVFGELDECRVLLLGAGKVGQLAARSLASRGARIAYVASRTPGRAAELAAPFGAVSLSLASVMEALADVDIVVASTSAPGVVLTADSVTAAIRRRRGRALFLIDLAVPRDLDPAIHDAGGCFLYDIDDLQAVVGETLAGRRREAERAEAIVAEHAERFRSWQASLEVVPAIASLRARGEEIRSRELAKAAGRLGRLSDEDRRAVESLTAAIVNKLLHTPTVRMKEAAAAADGGTYVEALRHLFELGEDDRPSDRLPRE